VYINGSLIFWWYQKKRDTAPPVGETITNRAQRVVKPIYLVSQPNPSTFFGYSISNPILMSQQLIGLLIA
jgi:hypothetical protein